MPDKRERWDSRGAFIMAAIGSAVGLGNVWRFPYIAYQNGGGAFFLPYFVALLTAGIPLMIVEYALGVRFQGAAPASFRKIGKGWEWIGWWALMVGSVISFYYCVIMAWSWDYLLESLKAIPGSTLPWAHDATAHLMKDVLHRSAGAEAIGGIVWPVLAGLALTWVLIWWIIHRGVGRVGKIVMLTVPLPVLILVVLFFRGITLPGAMDGIRYYLEPQWGKLWHADIWLAAYGQVFFSLSLGFGILIAYASYLPKRSDITNNAFITSFANCATSFFAGFVVFSIVGYLAFRNGVGVDKVANKGIILAFVTYPTAIAKIQAGNAILAVLSALFFLMLLSLGIDSAFSIVEGLATGLSDKFRWKRNTICTLVCTVGFLAGIIFCTDAGLYWLDIVDHWMNQYGLAAVGLFECVVVGWFFGANRLKKFVNEVSDFRLGIWWDLCVMVITPGILVWLLYKNFLDDIAKPYEAYPSLALWIGGWGVTILVVVLGFVFMFIRGRGDAAEEVEE